MSALWDTVHRIHLPSGPPCSAIQPRTGGPPREDQAARCPPPARCRARCAAASRSMTASVLQHSKNLW
eukprot:14212017-Alexandrium_andersonii.AAC.1